jgi:hypothetical protein
MQKRVLAGLPILAAALIFIGLWIAEKITIPPWQLELNQYIAYQASPSDPPINIQRTIQASLPWQFRANMSAGTFSDCLNFQTNYCYNRDDYIPSPPLLFPPGEIKGQTDIFNNPDEIFSSAPLNFPPEEVRCALLTKISNGEKTDWVVYIAKHQDLYNADWIVHESSRGIADPQLRVDLADIGCDRLMEPGQ